MERQIRHDKFPIICFSLFMMALLASQESRADDAKGGKDSKEETVNDYKRITGSDENQRQGLFNVYKTDDDYYFEIPREELDKDLLVVNRLLRVPKELNEAGVNRGINYETQMIRFSLSDNKKTLFIKQQRPLPQTPDGDIIRRSVADNYISPFVAALKVEAWSKDSAVVVKVTDLFNGKETTINDVFTNINLNTSAKNELSTIKSIKAFENNVVARSLLTTKVTEGKESVYITVDVSSTIVKLPEKPMQAREESRRIGYFTSDHLFFSDTQQHVDNVRYITRWRLEPKDTAAYLRGKLTEPVKPITFYIDSDIPSKWRPYLEKGITDWNIAFEQAGFKNAVRASFLPDSIKEMGDDINFSTLTYAASTKQNAMGPSTLDPRSGEIIEADIVWWHNVRAMLQEWITMQTGAICPEARTVRLLDELMGDAMRFVICHEVGHSLGLRHNMIASWAVPTDSLRSKTWTDKHPYNAASIMDYARYNYVAQPEDGVTRTAPHIGPYDLLAIEYGYRWYGCDAKREKKALDELLNRHTSNIYKYSEAQTTRDAIDPRAQSEDLGDDAIRSSEFGIKNLKVEIDSVIAWTTTGELSQSYDEASRLYYTIANQWNTYMYHVMANIGGIYIENTSVGDGQKTFTYVPKARQQEALTFIMENALTYPRWLFGNELSDYVFLQKTTPNGVVEQAPTQVLKNAQAYILFDLLNDNRMMRIIENENRNKQDAFTLTEMMNALHNHIFATTIKGKQPDIMERSTQKLFVDALITAASKEAGIKINKKLQDEQFLSPEANQLCHIVSDNRYGGKREFDFYGSQVNRTSDVISVKRGELLKIRKLCKRRNKDATEAVRHHYDDIIIRIDNALSINPD